ncbi:MAG: Hsp20/alpha crystallin family protein [Lachnospiraceae bacterium]|nr:Hsp20/alpha crystallin family protein [Lachnospiraceae bacterium]
MLLPSIFGENLLDDWMDFPRMDFPDVDRKLYGKHASHVMKTDVHEHEEGYEVDIDLPGFKKDEIHLDLENGYLSVNASKQLDKEEKNKKGKLIRQERYCGSMQRSFYVGENITEEDIKAKYEDGVLKLSVPKKEAKKIPEKKTIAIEG